ncbi:phosphoesterase, MJ0936 family [Cnuella takakiae]|uniref:Phosphoesterase, MJ0936 family n=1 Tax=Cnuella takakiae TaxID=1302690 RepID=A0A1M5BRH1_9BACT|nr:metallophosphoesterase family protein [Cnuella takakiae]OLY93479.1 YfcE family phosphodiesterase [Cnuella takakiae]SHF44832.1 phosphoesterase, MJ0936 family [Cnuella takakiae]
MKIALFSDIHANLPALEAFFESVAAKKPDAIYCLGDLVGYNTWPNEVINAIRQRGIPTIKGNYDEGIGLMRGDCGCAYKTEKDQENGSQSIAYTDAVVGAAERSYLRGLPAHIRVDFSFHNEKNSLLLVHGSPRRINEYLFEDREEKSLLRILQDAQADILCFGHTHKPYHRIMQAPDGRLRHAINTGSVGKPKDGDPRGCYVLLTINPDVASREKEHVTVEFVRFDYDVEKAAASIEASPLPNDFADMLRKGY